VSSWDRDVVRVQIVKPSEDNLSFWAIHNKLNRIELCGGYGSIIEMLWRTFSVAVFLKVSHRALDKCS